MQVSEQVGLTFATALRAILRQAPNVVMIGEIRDQETAENAIQASLTGHLVFSTLHTNDAAGAFMRLVDMGVEPFMISSSLEGVLGQRLIRKICPNCKTEIKLTESLAAPLLESTKRQFDARIAENNAEVAKREANGARNRGLRLGGNASHDHARKVRGFCQRGKVGNSGRADSLSLTKRTF